MSFFDKNALKGYDPSRSSKLYNGGYDGTKVAKQLGWDIFDRYKLTNIDGSHEDAHPIIEVLEIAGGSTGDTKKHMIDFKLRNI